ncbi:MAG: hypothetical protein Ct9H300mP25_04020 [Acidobacteriota bacterium]|nr:MAG: hypothetical protein Ct9H300mP25_04020 [Acidobacteriota bacterium]
MFCSRCAPKGTEEPEFVFHERATDGRVQPVVPRLWRELEALFGQCWWMLLVAYRSVVPLTNTSPVQTLLPVLGIMFVRIPFWAVFG